MLAYANHDDISPKEVDGYIFAHTFVKYFCQDQRFDIIRVVYSERV